MRRIGLVSVVLIAECVQAPSLSQMEALGVEAAAQSILLHAPATVRRLLAASDWRLEAEIRASGAGWHLHRNELLVHSRSRYLRASKRGYIPPCYGRRSGVRTHPRQCLLVSHPGVKMTRPSQPTPTVTEDDVIRIVRRDYPAGLVDEILALIAAVEVREKARVVLGCLKIANGDLDRLRRELKDASGYYREILGEAEYPLATKRWSRIESFSDDEVRAIYEKDWRQYSEWLARR